jgi:uncharacterized RDD family membrane protein YckC
MAQRGQQGIVTPEAVLLEFDTAGVGSRIVGRSIDAAAQGLAAFVVLLALTSLFTFGGLPEWFVVVLVLFGLFIVIFGYSVIFETLWNGKTPGKSAMGLRVVTAEGAPIRFRHAAIRAIVGIIDFMLVPGGALAIVTSLLSRRTQRLGDLAAGTIVLRERTAAMAPSAVTFRPFPGWEPYVASLDVGSLTAEEYGLVRSFLMRVNELEPGARVALAVRLATPIAARINHTIPAGVHPEHFLVSIAAAYQQRFAAAGPIQPEFAPPSPAPPPFTGATAGATPVATPGTGAEPPRRPRREPLVADFTLPAQPPGEGAHPADSGFAPPE